MRAALWATVLVVLPLAGCLGGDSDGDDAPDPLRPTGYRKEAFTVSAFDGEALAAVAYVPRTSEAAPEGGSPKWPVVVFLHGWGFFKEQFEGTESLREGARPPSESGAPEELGNILARFAAGGMIAVAYDARGFGQSTGAVTMAGPAEMADLDAVLDHVQAHFDASGRLGLVGVSYGAGQALIAWADDPRIDTAVAMFGWHDLYDALLPRDVPKLEWAQALFAVGVAGGKAQTHPMLADWYRRLYTREDLDTMQQQMAIRSPAGRMEGVEKPLLVCQGLQESLFPQAELIAAAPAGPAPTYIYTGGHNLIDPGCLDRALAWSHHHLGGFDVGVEGWPALETQDAGGDRSVSYATWPETTVEAWHPRAPDLARAPNDLTFTVEQRVLQNPFTVPAVVADALGPDQAIPEAFRQDPNAVVFASAPLAETTVFVGAAELDLHLGDANQTGWQVAARLLHEDADGRSRVLARTAYAALGPDPVPNGTAHLRFPFTKADLAAGDRLVLEVAANDPSWFMPLFADYAVTFTGASALRVPVFTG